jgi:F-type H+-transporting ATPase subunit a
MHDLTHIGPRIVLKFSDNFFVTETVFFAVIIAVIIAVVLCLLARKLTKIPGRRQVVAEFIVKMIYNLVEGTMGKHCLGYAPYIGTLFIFLILCNMGGLFGIRPPTADVNFTFACAAVTFILIQSAAIRSHGVIGYIKHFGEPYPFLFPIKVVEEISFPISLSFRLFGNILGGVIIMALLFQLMEFVSEKLLHLPIPLLQAIVPLPGNFFFDIFEPILQAFIFSMLTMAFIAKAIVTEKAHEEVTTAVKTSKTVEATATAATGGAMATGSE